MSLKNTLAVAVTLLTASSPSFAQDSDANSDALLLGVHGSAHLSFYTYNDCAKAVVAIKKESSSVNEAHCFTHTSLPYAYSRDYTQAAFWGVHSTESSSFDSLDACRKAGEEIFKDESAVKEVFCYNRADKTLLLITPKGVRTFDFK